MNWFPERHQREVLYLGFIWWLLLNGFPAVPVTAQGIPNGEAALQHAAYPSMQPFPGVGE